MFAVRATAGRRLVRLISSSSSASSSSAGNLTTTKTDNVDPYAELKNTQTLGTFLDKQAALEGSTSPSAFSDIPEVDGPPIGSAYDRPNPLSFFSASLDTVKLPVYRVHCHSSRNNTVVTLTRPDGGAVGWISGGSTRSKFKKGNRASYEAGYQCATGIFEKIRETRRLHGDLRLELLFKGFGEGREAMKGAFLAVEGADMRDLVVRVVDRTPIRIGGTRAKKTRRG